MRTGSAGVSRGGASVASPLGVREGTLSNTVDLERGSNGCVIELDDPAASTAGGDRSTRALFVQRLHCQAARPE